MAESDHTAEITSLEKRLRDVGLDPNTWLHILRDEFMITSYKALNFLTDKEFQCLKKHATQAWQVKALYSLTGLVRDGESGSSYQQKELQEITERKGNVMKMVAGFENLKTEEKKKMDESVKENKDKIRSRLSIPDDKWVHGDGTASFENIIENLDKYFNEAKKICKDVAINPSAIVQNASGGMMLRGFLLTKQIEECIKTRGQLLQLPDRIEIKRAMDPTETKVIDIKSKQKSDFFHRSLQTSGISLAATIEGGGFVFSAKGDVSIKHNKEEEQDHGGGTENTFVSKVICSLVPTGYIEIEARTCIFTEGALKSLKNIEELDKIQGEGKNVQAACESFLLKYGSHFYTGSVHVGGIYTLETTYSGTTKLSKDKIKSLVETSSSAFAAASVSGKVFSIGGSISADNLNQKGSIKCYYEQSCLSATQLRCQILGGPQDAHSLHDWITGLLADSNTWAVIDRGELNENNSMGVWDLIRYQTGSFKDKTRLSGILFQAWQHMTRINIDDKGRLIDYMSVFTSKVESVIHKSESSEQSISYCDALQCIQQEVQQSIRMTGTTNCWEILLQDNKTVSDFIVKAISDKWEESEIELIKSRIKELITNVNFLKKEQLLNWLQFRKQIKFAHCLVKKNEYVSAEGFLSVLENKILPEVLLKESKCEASADTKKQFNIHLTQLIAQEISQVLTSLEKPSRETEYVLLASLLSSLSYNVQKRVFDAIITIQNVNDFISLSHKKFKQFQNYQTKGEIQTHAFLIHLAIECIRDDVDHVTREMYFSGSISTIRKMLNKKVKSILEKTACQSQLNFFALSDALGKLMKGDVSKTKFSIGPFKNLQQERTTTLKKDVQVQINKQDVFQNMDIVARLGLRCNVLTKICIPEVICLTTTGDGKTVDYAGIPWLCLKHIMSNDLRWRDSIIPEIQIQLSNKISPDKTEYNPLDDIKHLLSDATDCPESTCMDVIHPLDIFITTFLCCSEDLKQLIVQKLFMCKQAVPLLYSVPYADKPIFSLLPLRSLPMECRTTEDKASVTCAATQAAKIVGFIRVGSASQSKSKLLNEVASDLKHPAFCYRDGLPAETKPIRTEGLIEVSWFLPSGKKTDPFKEVVTFINLRGNATCHPKELSVMGTMSTVIVVVVDLSCIVSETTISLLQQLRRTKTRTVLMLTINSLPMDKKRFTRDYNTCCEKVGKDSGKDINVLLDFDPKTNERKTAATIRNDMRLVLAKLIENQEGRSLRDCGYNLSKKGLVTLDESTEECMKGMLMASRVYSKLCNTEIKGPRQLYDDLPTVGSKTNHLPLQGQLWKDWSNLNKEQSKTCGSKTPNDIGIIKCKMEKIRQDQRHLCTQLPPAVAEMIQCLHENKNVDERCLRYVMWFKMFLNENSRKTLPALFTKYQNAWTEVSAACRDSMKNGEDIKTLKRIATETEKELAEASFGFEHFIRELGQIYESAMDSKCKIGTYALNTIRVLPNIVARLLLKGHALEIMDGDVANIPLKWIKAVLANLQRIIDDKKLFVISVLGIQSSGKSTLLNAMFGLRFAVSAGRCTRGIFAQLVPAEKENILPYDFILVIDTEGLRAPELGQVHYDHDNQLATFVIGIGDITLINIKGENTAEIKDVLQIVVQAFLRMNLANKRVQSNRKCIFIHQNVGAVNAKEQMMQGLKKFQDNLDKMTQHAAEEEEICNIVRFSQVIDFEGSKHVMYFPDLWSGDPPMAPCNPGYSVKVNEVKNNLLKMALDKKSFLTVSNLFPRIEDLWNGILSENFVFSFQNTLEIKAYNSLDSKYHEVTDTVYDKLSEWFENRACIQIKLCHNAEKLSTLSSQLESELIDTISNQKNEMEEALIRYFAENEMQEIVIQWKSKTLLRFANTVADLIEKNKNNILRKLDERGQAISLKTRAITRERELNANARALALTCRNGQLNEQELESNFNAMWTKWTSDLVESVPPDRETTATKVKRCLNDRCIKDASHIHKCLVETSKNTSGILTPIKPMPHKLEGSWTIYDISMSELSKNVWKKFKDKAKEMLSKFTGLFEETEVLTVRIQAVAYTDNVFRKADRFLHSLSARDTQFNESHVVQLLSSVIKSLKDENNDTNHTFKFTSIYIARVIVHVCRYSVTIFERMRQRYEKKHGQKAKLEDYKSTAKKLFLYTVKQEIAEVVAAEFFCDRVKEEVTEAVSATLPRKIISEVAQYFSSKKYYVMLAVMEDLARSGSFDSYRYYIQDSLTFVYDWLEKHIDLRIFKATNEKPSRYMELVKCHVDQLMDTVESGIQTATKYTLQNSERGIKDWTEHFELCVELKVAIASESLQNVTEQKIADFPNFQKHVLDRFEGLRKDIIDELSKFVPNVLNWENTSEYESVMNKLWGCPEQCPFCNEPCKHSRGHEVCHSCIQHRPEGVRGVREERSKVLCIETCNYLIQNKTSNFFCSACNSMCKRSGKCKASKDERCLHEYMKYHTYLPEWDIAPSPSMDASKYWMWFMSTYKHQLTELHGAKEPDIPEHWKLITKEEALDSLREAVG